MTSSALKIGVVGAGKVARANYLPCLAADAGVTIGYYSRSRDKAAACAEQFGGAVFETPAALLAWQPDAVLVLTRETQRLDAASALLEHRPRRLFFEKPLVAAAGQENVTEQDFLDARDVLRRAEAVGCETAMVFNYRFFDHTLLAKQIIVERDFGALRTVTGLVHYACWSHSIDLIHHFAGPIADLTALQGGTVHTQGSFSAADVTAAFRMASGATGTLVGTATLPWTFSLFDLSFNFEHGRIRMTDLDGEMTVMDARAKRVQTFQISGDRSRWDMYNASFQKSLNAYLQSVREGASPPVPGRFGLLELQVEAAIKRSIATGAPVTLDAAFPLA
jgi:predicted dehydrogenase